MGKTEDLGVAVLDVLFFVIVNRGKANAVLRKAQECGAAGGTIFLGEGTVQSKLFEKLGLAKTQKEILVVSCSGSQCENLHNVISETFVFSKKNRGIAFSVPFQRKHPQTAEAARKYPAMQDFDEYCIMTIVDKGRSKDCIRAARAAGARGATLFRGRGAGVPTDFYFPLVIEPGKDIVMIVTTKDKVEPIKDRIFRELNLEQAGNGIIFVLPVIKTSGIHHDLGKQEGQVHESSFRQN